jgi:hypothetical protein
MIRYRVLLIAAGYADGNDSLKPTQPSRWRLPERGDDLCLQPTISRLGNLPRATALKHMMAAMVELFRDRCPGASCLISAPWKAAAPPRSAMAVSVSR